MCLQQPINPTPPGYVVSAPMVVEANESQRYDMLNRKWKAPYMPGDGPEFESKVTLFICFHVSILFVALLVHVFSRPCECFVSSLPLGYC